MTTEEVRALPLNQKIQIMETLWEDLRERFDRLDLPQTHKDLLDERRSRIQKGTDTLLDWDTVKAAIGRR
jgi:putative addiction module component (TIGR02574 family)